MKKLKLISCLLSAALIAASFAGCGSSASAEAGDTPAKQEQTPEQNQRGTMAKIVSMEGNTITVIPADIPDGSDGQPPASGPAAPGSGQKSDQMQASGPAVEGDGQRNEEPGGSGQNGEPGRSGQNGGPGQNGRTWEFTGDEITYTLSDSVKVTRGRGNDASEIDLSDIEADSIIMFTTSDEGGSEVITSIRVLEQVNTNSK